MEQTDETTLLGYCLRPLGEEGASAIAQILSDSEAENLRQALAAFLVAKAQEDPNLLDISSEQVPTPPDFKSVLYRDTGLGSTKKIVTFGFRDAAVEAALPFLGMAIALFTGIWGIANSPSLLSIVKTFWSKLVVLRRPADADAIDVLEALFRVRARLVTASHAEYRLY
jgi:hypothetical protein